MIENVVFDMGNVLSDFDYRRAYEGLAPYLDMDYERFDREIVRGEKKEQSDTGKITPRDLYESLVDDYALRCDYEVFAAAWQSIFTDVDEMIDFAISLRPKYGVYLLSSTDPLHMEIQKKTSRLYDVTDKMGLSYELGAVKPARIVYERFLEKFDLEGPSCVFIDDIEENARAAEQVGMAWVHHRSPQETIAKLAEMGVR